ncbi:hypothetical protein FRB96_009633 [Tulasnella sp. 330]|nr:hypothetical protein FRB96_009633 [Tulasnella sp. 330]KAG8877066.1 hypothetical protein FRB97_003745 [Tulasnella sp. 331]KAG8881581.1 hypothetical protein FRB98_004243 [Tulasnella sp. 332]
MVPDQLTVSTKHASLKIKSESGFAPPVTAGPLEQSSDDLVRQIRESVELLEWEDPAAEIAADIAFWRSTRWYEQNIWRDLCARLGVADAGCDASAEPEVNWQELACSKIESTFEQPGCGCRLKRALDWERGHKTASQPMNDMSNLVNYDLNPLFSSLYLNWWTISSASGAVSSQTASIPHILGAFWLTHQPDASCTVDSLVLLEPMRREVALCTLATDPPTTALALTFQPNYKDVLDDTSATCRVQRDRGVRVIDVIQAIQTWLRTHLTDDQKSLVAQQLWHQTTGIFCRLKDRTDAAHWKACIDKVFDARGSLLTGEFVTLELEPKDGELIATVVCAPRDLALSQLSTSMIDSAN